MSQNPCPTCGERVHQAAVICCHCHAQIVRAVPAHAGTCLFCYGEVDKAALLCRHCGHDISIRPDGPERIVQGRRVVMQDPDRTRIPPEAVARLIGPASPGRPSPGTGPAAPNGGKSCIRYPWIECDVIEEIDPIAGYLPKRYENCRIVWRDYCV